MKLTLYGLKQTRSVRPQWLMEELGLKYEMVNINIFKGEGFMKSYRKIHPYGLLPALDIDGQIIFESGAICHWLTDMYPEKALAPAIGTPLRAKYEQWMFFVTATLEPYAWHFMLHSKILPQTKRIAALADWNREQYIYHLKVLNRLLNDKKYLLGENFSTADIMLGYLLFWFPDLLEKFSELNRYSKKLKNRKAYLSVVNGS